MVFAMFDLPTHTGRICKDGIFPCGNIRSLSLEKELKLCDGTELTGQPFVVRGGGVMIISAVIEQEENSEDSALAVLLFINNILRLFEKNVKTFRVSATIPVGLV